MDQCVDVLFSQTSAGDLCIQPHSETAETSNHVQGLHIPPGLTGSCVFFNNNVTVYLMPSPPLNLKIFQLKNDDEEDEERKNSRVSQERQRTLDRLRTFKQVCALPAVNVRQYLNICVYFLTDRLLSLTVPFSSGTQVK